MEDITNSEYTHAKRVREDFQIKHLGGYPYLYVQDIKTYTLYPFVSIS